MATPEAIHAANGLSTVRASAWTDQTRQELMHQLYDIIQEVLDLPPDQVLVIVSDTPSSWLMEAGLVLPEPVPDAEALWMRKLSEMFPGKYEEYA